jgi:hypothetical protein
MTGLLGVMVLMFEFENDNFVTFGHTFGSRHHFGALNGRGTYGNVFIVRNQQDLVQFNLVTLGFVQQVNIDCLARSDFVLFAAGFNYSVNGTPPITQQLYIVADNTPSMQRDF